MSIVTSCPGCGLPSEFDAPGALCPSCLSQAGPAGDRGATRDYRSSSEPGLDLLGRLIPHLEIHEVLGRGGMGVVYKARQTKLDRPVALKLIRPDSADDPAFASRFGREARAMARLNHPNIVTVHDFGEAEGLFYLVMEWIDGGDLRDRLRIGGLAELEAVRLAIEISDALGFAHSQGVIHRDIKPENILCDREGRARIADFGLAKLTLTDSGSLGLTNTRQVMGSPHYMAPEQWEDPKRVDHRVDVYAAGVVLYEMLTGSLPLGRFALPSERAGTDPRLDAIVLKAMERDPDRRYQAIAEMRSDLSAIRRDPTPRDGAPLPDALVDLIGKISRKDREPSQLDVARRQVQAPAEAMIAAGVAVPLALMAYSLYIFSTYPNAHMTSYAALMIGTFAALGVFLAIAGIQARRLHGYGMVRVASWLAIFALNPGSLWTLPAGIFLMNRIGSPEVEEAFAIQKRKDKERRHRVSKAGKSAGSEIGTERPRLPWIRIYYLAFRNSLLLGVAGCFWKPFQDKHRSLVMDDLLTVVLPFFLSSFPVFSFYYYLKAMAYPGSLDQKSEKNTAAHPENPTSDLPRVACDTTEIPPLPPTQRL